MKKEYMYAGTSVLCFGTVATASKLLMNQLDAVYVLAFSFLAATLFLGIYNWKKGYLHELRELSRKTVIRMVVIGSLGVFFYNYFLLLGTARLEAQTAFVINELWPALIILFSWWILGVKDEHRRSSGSCFLFSRNSGCDNGWKADRVRCRGCKGNSVCPAGSSLLWFVLYVE